MADAVELRPLPPQEAIAFFRSKGYRPTFSYLDMSSEGHSHAFTVAGVTRLDVLEDIRGLLDQAEAEGTTLADFKKALQPKLAAKGWWGPVEVKDEATGEVKTVDLSSSRRLRTIFNTNLRTSYAAGQWARIQRTKKALPFLVYKTMDDGHVRRLHRGWHDLVLPVDHAWWATHFPPNDWGCRCTVLQMTAGMVKRAGLTVHQDAPYDGPDVQWTNPRTNETSRVPRGVAPSFAGNPGQMAHFPDPARYKGEAFAREAARLAVESPDFAKIIAAELQGSAPVAWVDEALAKALDVAVRRVDLSAETVAKQIVAHADLALPEYRQLPALIQDGLAVQDSDPTSVQLFGLLRAPDGLLRLYRAVVKRNSAGEALFLVTFHRARAAQLRAALERQAIRDQEALRDLRLTPGGVVDDERR